MALKKFYVTLVIIARMRVIVTAIKIAPREKKMPTTVTEKNTNRLIDEGSPYLLQHAHNPVDWYPWGTEAFEKAKNENKPIFLSIGYSTCHWCHVMEKESFENQKIARIMNDYFVSIKVDREERPDIDQIYMNAVIATTGNGGWPLSVFLTPEGEVFYGGTYLPPTDSYGRVGFEHLLLRIAQAWKNKQKGLVTSAKKITEFLQNIDTGAEKSKLSPKMLKKAFLYLRNHFDKVNGGFGGAPKFPQPTNLSMLLCYWQKTAYRQALDMVEKTLDAMAKGGIYDHIGGGFHRYSTDECWLVPHFEKMLYNQALLSKVYLQGYQITGKHHNRRIAREIFDYVLRDMTDADGGFYSAEDADSEGKEGTFYLWTPEQTASVLEQEQTKIFNSYYGVTEKGNFEKGKMILNIKTSAELLGKKHQKGPKEIENILADARTKIFEERQKRSRPYKDDKIITAWNGLMISSLAFGGRVLQEDRYTEAAKGSAEFILSTLHKDGRLTRYYHDGRVKEKAFLDDYAFMILGLLDLYEATFESKWLAEATKLVQEMVELFSDSEEGGFFLTGRDGEKLIASNKPSSDGALPSGNSVAALVLLKLGRLTMNKKFTEQGTKVLEAFSHQLEQSPAYSSAMLTALNFQIGPTQEIVISGDADATDTKQMLELINSKFLPNAIVLLHEQGDKGAAIEQIVPFVKNQTAIGGRATAYVCENYVCKNPVNNLSELEGLLVEANHNSRNRA